MDNVFTFQNALFLVLFFYSNDTCTGTYVTESLFMRVGGCSSGWLDVLLFLSPHVEVSLSKTNEYLPNE